MKLSRNALEYSREFGWDRNDGGRLRRNEKSFA